MRLAVLLLASVVAFAGDIQEKPEPFAAATFAALDGTPLPYRLLQPDAPVPGMRYPLVLQLHGSGAIGTDNRAQIGAFSNGWLLPEARNAFPAFVLVPQFSSRTVEYAAVADPSRLRSRSLSPLAAVFALVEQIATQFPVDRNRIYITGFSMGASSALQAVLARPDLFAAAVAIAPVPPDSALAPSRPILMLHGDADTENPFAASRSWFESMLTRGAAGLEFRAYPGVRHEIPAEVLTDMWWREWLFSQRLGATPRIVGTWQLLTRTVERADGTTVVDRVLGEKPAGRLVYDANGGMMLQMMRMERKGPIATPSDPKDKTNPRVILGYDSYFGRYTVDEKAGTVTHHVEGSLFPEDLGSDWIRPFTLEGDALTLRLTSADGLARTLVFSGCAKDHAGRLGST